MHWKGLQFFPHWKQMTDIDEDNINLIIHPDNKDVIDILARVWTFFSQ